MTDKLKLILTSVRFWIITTSALSVYFAGVADHGFVIADLFSKISIWLGVVSGVGTLDSVATKLNTTTPTTK